MIGAIIGDIAGSRFEFNNAKSDKFKLLARECSFTDDTICTVAIADAVMNGRKFDDALRDWCGRYPHPMGGYGASFGAWIHSPGAGPYWSFGNGAAMRVSAIPFLATDHDQALEMAMASALVTHDHPEGVKGAATTATAGYVILEGRRAGESVEKIKTAFRVWVEGQYDIPEYRPFSNPFNESCMNAVPVGASCLLASTSFEDAIRKAILVGGDSDTICAIVGGWAEALYGVPEGMRKMAMTYLPGDIRAVVQQFYRTVIY